MPNFTLKQMIAALATDENLRILVDSYLTNTGVSLLDRVEDYIKAEGPMSYRHLELNPPEGLSSSEARSAVSELITKGKVFINGDLRIAIKPASFNLADLERQNSILLAEQVDREALDYIRDKL